MFWTEKNLKQNYQELGVTYNFKRCKKEYKINSIQKL